MSDSKPTLERLAGLLGDYASRTATWGSLGSEHLLQQLVVDDFGGSIAWSEAPAAMPRGADGLPVPPVSLTMGYGAGDLGVYMDSGRRSYERLTALLREEGVRLEPGDAILDWGCAAGRVLRCFAAEARAGCEAWGCDVHAPSIRWAQGQLAPPFRFFNSSKLPRLPFPDGHFKFVYGMSVMTHLAALRDLWLLELRRVLRPDGCLILTVHNEQTWAWFREHGMPVWLPRQLRDRAEMPGECLEIRGSRWEETYTFFRNDYLRRVWGQLIEVHRIVDCADDYQAAVVLRRRA